MSNAPTALDAPARPKLLTSGTGTNAGAFGTTEWSLLTVIATIWGASFVLMEIGLTTFAPGLVTLLRVGLGALALSLVPRARRTRFAREDLPRVALLGVIWMGIPLLLFPVAQQWIDSSVAGMMNGAVPLTVAAWSVVLLRRLPGRIQLVGLAVGFLGMVAISLPELPLDRLAASGSAQTALGTGLVLVAMVLYGLSANLAVPLQQRYGSLATLFRAQLAALVVILPFGLWGLTNSTFAWGPALAMIPLGVLGTGLAFVLMATLVGRVGGPRGAVALYVVPVVAMVLGVVALGEEIHPLALVGMALVLLGAWITSRRDASVPQPTTPPAAEDASPTPPATQDPSAT